MTNPTNAFEDLAKGNFQAGLDKLNKYACWHDLRNDLDGPFRLVFPGVSGWGEALLSASLLKRHAANLKHGVTVFANEQVSSIIRKGTAFCVRREDDGQGRSPLAILRHALTGDLLTKDFERLCAPVHGPDDGTGRPRVGIVWASIRGNCRICSKSIQHDKFQTIFDGLSVDLVSFQIREGMAGRLEMDCARPFCDDELKSKNQTPVVQEISKLSCMVTVSTTTAHIAAALGIKVFLLAKRRNGQQWFWQAQADHNKHLYSTVDVFLGDTVGDAEWWCGPVSDAKATVADYLNGLQ